MNADELIVSRQVTMYKATYNRRTKWMRQRSKLYGWIAKQIMLSIIYPGDLGDSESGPYPQDHFEDWEIVKAAIIPIVKTEGIEAAREFVINYIQNDYNPPS